MHERLVQECIALLNSITEATINAVQTPHSDGSVKALEVARDEQLGDGIFPIPFAFAHEMHETLVYGAGERLITLTWCLNTRPPHMLSANELARATAEAAAAAAWLGDAAADGEERIQRLLGLLKISDEEEAKLGKAIKRDLTSGGTQLILDWAENRGTRAKGPGSKTDLLERVSADTGRADYSRLSAFAHGTLWSVIAGYLEVTMARQGNLGPIQVHSVQIATVAAHYMLAGLHSLLRVKGHSMDQLAGLGSRLELLDARTTQAFQHTDWH